MIYVHDIIAISGLAVRVYTSYKDSDAPDHRHISEDIAALRVLIDKVASHSKSTTISNDYHHCGQKTLKACQSVLEDLNSFIEKYKRLASIDKRLVFNVVKLGKHDITVLHSQLISNTGLLNGFVRSYEYVETQAQLAALLGLHGTNSRISVTSIATFAANTSTEIAYKQFRKDLHQIGVPDDLIQKNEDEIREIFKSQGMVASSQIGSSDTGDKDQVLETAYEEYCKALYQLGFTDDMFPPKDKILRVLRSRGVVASNGAGEKGKLGYLSTANLQTDNSSTKVLPSFRFSSRVNWFESSSEAASLVPEAINEENSPSLQIPASNIHSIMELLFGKHSSTKIIDEGKDNTPLHLAAGGGYTGLVEFFLGNTPSNLLAAPKGRTTVLKQFFGKGTSIEAEDTDNNTPLNLAASKGHTGTVDLLLREGASINAGGHFGQTSLHRAGIAGHTGTVELLLAKGASIDTRDYGNNTALNLAAWKGCTDVVDLLLRKGASIEAMGYGGKTPLHFAALKGQIGVAELLLKNGASIEARDNYNHTPLDMAARGGHTDMVQLLENKAAELAHGNRA